MKLRMTSCVWLCLIVGGAAGAVQAATPYAYGPSAPAFAPAELDKVKAPVPAKAPAQAKNGQAKAAKVEDPTVGLPAGPQPYVPSAPAVAPAPVKTAAPVISGPQPYVPAAPVVDPLPAKPIAAKPAPKAAPVKASAQVAPLPATGSSTAPLATCTYNQIRKAGFDAYVGRMWAARTPEAQKALIGCIDQAWNYHLSAANADPNSHFEEQASPAMLAAMQYDVDGFVKDLEGRQKLRLMWLATLASDSFSWRSAQPCQHEPQRRSLQVLLDDRKAELQSLVAYRDIQDAFSNIQCRTSAAN